MELAASLEYETVRRKQAEAALELTREANHDLEDRLRYCTCGAVSPPSGPGWRSSSPTRLI
jgi:hypothetical protein